MRSVIVVPARYKSSRFPGKPLAQLNGKPMIIWVAELSSRAVGKENVYIATDDNRIADVVSEHGYTAVITSGYSLTGTDRVAEAAKNIESDIYINVQGDEPLILPEDILKISEYKKENFDCVINGFCYLSGSEDPHNVNIPKVITTEDDYLVYMSRAALPAVKDQAVIPESYKKQVCIYAYSRQELELFSGFGRKSELERFEDIEILRFLELDRKIKMVETTGGSLAVDVPSDVIFVEQALSKLDLN